MNKELKTKALLFEARRWVGIVESSPNSGEMIKRFQLSVNPNAGSEAWCVAFIEYCVQTVDKLFTELFSDSNFTTIPKTESSLFLFDYTDKQFIQPYPSVGSIAVWRDMDGTGGHAGLVTSVGADTFQTIEGNTSPGYGVAGPDGVYAKVRYKDRPGSLKILGFIQPWK